MTAAPYPRREPVPFVQREEIRHEGTCYYLEDLSNNDKRLLDAAGVQTAFYGRGSKGAADAALRSLIRLRGAWAFDAPPPGSPPDPIPEPEPPPSPTSGLTPDMALVEAAAAAIVADGDVILPEGWWFEESPIEEPMALAVATQLVHAVVAQYLKAGVDG